MTIEITSRKDETSEFLRQLKAFVLDEEEETHRRVSLQIPLTVAILAWLGRQDGLHLAPLQTTETAQRFFENRVLPEIQAFARTPSEERAILADLLVWEATSIANHFKA